MCLKIGEHLDIHINHKILHLRLIQTVSFLGLLVYFQGTLFFGSFHEKHGSAFRD